MIKKITFQLLLCLPLALLAQSSRKADEKAVRAINQEYVKAWLVNDENRILALFEQNASITPSGAGFFKGKEKIRNFWFPKDSSVTTIEKFSNKIMFLQFEGDVIVATTKSELTWNYRKADFFMAKDQAGVALTFYRRQADGTWKIWKQVWSDLWAKDKK